MRKEKEKHECDLTDCLFNDPSIGWCKIFINVDYCRPHNCIKYPKTK